MTFKMSSKYVRGVKEPWPEWSGWTFLASRSHDDSYPCALSANMEITIKLKPKAKCNY